MISLSPSGVETNAPTSLPAESKAAVAHGSYRLIQAVLFDQTDVNAELLQQHEWLVHPSQKELLLQGNAFALENTLDGSGTVWVKQAPLPHARSHTSQWDFRLRRDGSYELNQSDNYPWLCADYEGGKWGRIATLHLLQRAQRPYNPDQDGLLLTNTWGDRARDAHLQPAFMRREIEAAARLGADVVQIDDGWQQGITANSAKANGGGAWNGFWASNPNFWDVNRERFPDGLQPLIELAKQHGMRMGLWFAPDSSNHAANWRRDADALLKLHRELEIDFFKIDALKIESPQAEENLRRLFHSVQQESQGHISFDFDITAERRFGYFDLMEPGRLFVENRYTDWHNYWPHQTLRVAWQLAHWVDPVRLRLEWLNNARNLDMYANDPLAPAAYRPDALFATVMFCSPLGWFENQNLPESYFEEAGPLIATWKQHREAMQGGTVLPIGQTPDGAAWTGFVSIYAERNGGYALLFRELNRSENWQVELPFLSDHSGKIEVLGGDGSAELHNGVLHVQIPDVLRFLWVRFSL
jgi:alpha-galactosidase